MLLHRAKKLTKQIVFIFVIIGLTEFAYAANPASNAKPAPQPPAIHIETAKVQERLVPLTLSSIGTLYAQEETELSFGGEGHLEKIIFPEGSEVKKGDIIAVLDSRAASAQLASAKARLTQAQSNFRRYQLVKDKNVFSAQEQVSIKTALEEAKADEKVALSTLQNLQLKAPYNGVLGNYQYDIGTFINTGTPLVRLVDIAKLEVKYSLSQQDRNKVKTGQIVKITASAVPKHIFTGKVMYVAPTVNPSTGRFDLKAIVSNKDRLLSPGFSTNVIHFLGEKRKIIIIPQTAIVANGKNYFVFKITPNNHAEQIMVTIGDNTNDGFTEIKTGLKAGDTVATAGQDHLENGTLVTINNTDTTKVTAPISHQNNNTTLKHQASPVENNPSPTVKPTAKSNQSSANVQPTDTDGKPKATSMGEQPKDQQK